MRRLLFYLSMAAAVGYGGLLIWKTSFAVGGSDSSGYANTAKMIAGGRVVQPVEALDFLELPDRFDRVFMPLAHEAGPRPRTMVPFYPPGYPLHLAAAGIFGGWEYAPFLVSPLAALLLLLTTYFLARELSLSRPLASIAAGILGGCAVLLFQAVQPMSDVVAAAWACASVLFALRARRRDAWAILSGAAFGVAVLTRPTNILLVVPLAFALPWRPRAVTLFAAGGMPFAVFEVRWNSAIYGGPLRTGQSGILGDFAWSNFSMRFAHYGRTLAEMFSPLVPLGWIGAAADRRVPLRDRALLVLWFTAYVLLYCFWGPYETWWYTRYLLPAFPALVIGAVLVARDLLRLAPEIVEGPFRSPRLAVALAAVLFLIVANAERRGIKKWNPLEIADGEKTYPLAMDLARKLLPDRSLVVAMQFSGALRYYTNFQPVRWDGLEPADFDVVRAKAESKGYRLYALLFPWEEKQLAVHTPGKWKKVGAVRDVTLWELE
jgi:hypothetical protein